MQKDLVSVIMGIYNCASTLPDAIDSILNQTYENIELVMCDDGSSDNTYEIAESYRSKYPKKIKLLKHETNLGLSHTLNDCIKASNGTFLARMDGDDISFPNRIEKEMEVFSKEPNISMVSCSMIFFDENGEWGRENKGRTEYPKKEELAKGVVHNHAPSIIKKEAITEVNNYSTDDKYLRVEDWNLWIKMYSHNYQGKNIKDCLYMVRDDKNAMKRKSLKTATREYNVSKLAIKTFHLSKINYLYSLRPIILGLLPKKVYYSLHRWKIENSI